MLAAIQIHSVLNSDQINSIRMIRTFSAHPALAGFLRRRPHYKENQHHFESDIGRNVNENGSGAGEPAVGVQLERRRWFRFDERSGLLVWRSASWQTDG
jgi:hypothetical protein